MNTKTDGWLDLREAAERFVSFLRDGQHISGKERACGAVCVTGVVGSAGLGKTAFCANVADILNRENPIASHVKLDGYLLERRTRRARGVNGYELGGWRVRCAESQLRSLISKRRSVEVPTYLPTGIHGAHAKVESHPLLLLDGNYSYVGKVRSLLSVLVYFKADLDTMKYLRIERDVTLERRFSLDEAKEVWERELETLRTHILVAEAEADVVVEVNRHRLLRCWCRARA